MENNITNEQLEQAEKMAEEEAPAAEETAEETAVNAEYEELKAAFREAKIKLALLLGGVSRDKLEDGTKLAEMLCLTGLTPEEAAEKTLAEYPQLKLTARELPKFSAEGSGSGDGFAAIRSIFAKR